MLKGERITLRPVRSSDLEDVLVYSLLRDDPRPWHAARDVGG